MATPKKGAVKSAAKSIKIVSNVEMLKLESNVPMPERGFRDPVFVEQVNSLLLQIKPKQSFVVPKAKLHTVKKLIRTHHEAMVFKSMVIKPEERFARIWRV